MKVNLPLYSEANRQSITALAVALLFIIIGVCSLAYGASTQLTPAKPTSDTTLLAKEAANIGGESTALEPLAYSIPVSITIPAIEVRSDLIRVGQNPDGTIEVPTGANYHKAAWYKHGATPGQLGSSVIEGHVDGDGGKPSIFFNLGALKQGDAVYVLRQDGKTAVFTIDAVGTFNKDEFPTDEVYGFHDSPKLALITCGGDFNASSGEYDSNVIASARFAGVE